MSRRWVTCQNLREKNGSNFFNAMLKTFISNFAFSVFYDLFTKKVRKLEVAESSPIMGNIPVSFSVSVRVPFLLFLVRVLSLTIYLSLSLFLFMLHFSCCYQA